MNEENTKVDTSVDAGEIPAFLARETGTFPVKAKVEDGEVKEVFVQTETDLD